MTPIKFKEANTQFGPPPDLTESQCQSIPAYVGKISGGSIDGSQVVVVAWKPSPDELIDLNAGIPVYLAMIGGLAPHLLTTNFESAIKPQ